MTGLIQRVWLWTAGPYDPARPGLPIGELCHPASLMGIVLLALNDHLLKGLPWVPGLVAGKLSDFAGLLFFPLLLTSGWNTLRLGIGRLLRSTAGPRLQRSQLVVALVVSGAVFAPLQLSQSWADLYVRVCASLGFGAAPTPDPTDLVALIMLFPAWRIGLAELARQGRGGG